MRVITIQSYEIFDDFLKNDIVYVDRDESQYNTELKQSYDKMQNLMKEKLNFDGLPFWGFHLVENLLPPTDMSWKYYDCKGSRSVQDGVLFELEVDEKEVLSMNYYEWADYIYYLGEDDKKNANIALDHLWDTDKYNTIQICLPYLNKENVKAVYNINNDKIYDIKENK